MGDRGVARARLEAIAELVPRRSRVADIGTDHARLPYLLLRSGRASLCIATERFARGAERLRRAAAAHPAPGALEIRHGDGLRALDPEDRIDVVVAAGLGARSILRLLDQDSAGRLGLSRVVLQPLTEPARLRRGLAERDYGIADERLALDGRRFYTVIAADRGREDRFAEHPVLDRDDLYEAGPCLVRCGDPLVKKLWLREREAQLRLLERAAGAGRRAAQRRLELAGRILAALDTGPV